MELHGRTVLVEVDSQGLVVQNGTGVNFVESLGNTVLVEVDS